MTYESPEPIKGCLSDEMQEDDEILEYHYPLVAENEERTLAARDSLALRQSSDRPTLGDSENPPYEVHVLVPSFEDAQRQRRRKGIKIAFFLALVAVLVLAVVLPTTKRENSKRLDTLGAGLEKQEDNQGDQDENNLSEDASDNQTDELTSTDEGDGECSKPTPYQNIPGFTACSSSSDCTVPGECCLADYCLCKAPDIFINEMCIGGLGAGTSNLGSEGNDDIIEEKSQILLAEAGVCDGNTSFQELETGFRSCSGTGECEVHLGECCVATWCFCKVPEFLRLNEKCVPDSTVT
jgi:hypothetical protein